MKERERETRRPNRLKKPRAWQVSGLDYPYPHLKAVLGASTQLGEPRLLLLTLMAYMFMYGYCSH